MKPLAMTNSPCAKFTTSVALKIRTNPSAISAYTHPVPTRLTTWLVRISTIASAALFPPDLLQLHPVTRPRPLAILHRDQPSGTAHDPPVVAAIGVLEAPP